jgi:hypothetical protein
MSSVTDLREDLERIRAAAQAGETARVIGLVERALQALDGSRLLTTTAAAELLGVRSVNTLKLLVLSAGVPYERHGNRMMIPVSSLEQLQQGAALRGIRASDHAHDVSADLGGEGLTEEELRDLEAARPGRLPWQAARIESWRCAPNRWEKEAM